eukprot:2303868-Rhodomonas_salina.1
MSGRAPHGAQADCASMHGPRARRQQQQARQSSRAGTAPGRAVSKKDIKSLRAELSDSCSSLRRTQAEPTPRGRGRDRETERQRDRKTETETER